MAGLTEHLQVGGVIVSWVAISVVNDQLSPKAASHVHDLLRYPFKITIPMIRWLKNLPDDYLGPYREEIHEVMERSGLSIFVPREGRG